MKKFTIYSLSAGLSVLCLLVAVYLMATGNISAAGPAVIAFFATLALAFRGYDHLKGFTYTIMIFAAVTTALYYPQYFIEYDGFKYAALITP